jgi:hypothetical protein
VRPSRGRRGHAGLLLAVLLAAPGLTGALAAPTAGAARPGVWKDAGSGAPGGGALRRDSGARRARRGGLVPPGAAPGATAPSTARRLAADGAPGPPASAAPCGPPLAPGAALRVERPCALALPPRLARPGAAVLGIPNAERRLPLVIPARGATGAGPPRMTVEPGALAVAGRGAAQAPLSGPAPQQAYPPPPTHAAPCLPFLPHPPRPPPPPPGATLNLTRLVIESADDEDPSDLAGLLTPNFLELPAGGVLSLLQGGKVMSLPPAAAARRIAAALGRPELQRELDAWRFAVYSDGRSWVHVNRFSGGGVSATNYAVVNAASPAAGGIAARTPSYALAVTNATIVSVLAAAAAVETPEPFLIRLSENATLWPRADWPAGGVAVLRPIVIVGQTLEVTSLDLGNCAGCASLLGRWSNVTFDSLVLENLGYGFPSNPNATTYSVISSTNIWFFNATRWVAGPGRVGPAFGGLWGREQRSRSRLEGVEGARGGVQRQRQQRHSPLAARQPCPHPPPPPPPPPHPSPARTPRREPRMVLRNCTLVLPLAREVDIKRYWSGVFNSPSESAWLRSGLNVTGWEARGAGAGAAGAKGAAGSPSLPPQPPPRPGDATPLARVPVSCHSH